MDDEWKKMDSGPQGLYGGSLYLLFFFQGLKEKRMHKDTTLLKWAWFLQNQNNQTTANL